MSTLLGPMRQIGYVVRDIEKALRYWTEINRVGPWFYFERFSFDAFTYRGQRHDQVNLSVALGNCGDMQLELIQQRCDTPSMWRDFIRSGHEGMQHFAIWPEDYEAACQRAIDSGFRVCQEGELTGRGRFVYFANEDHPGTVVELSHFTPARQRSASMIRNAAANWDGTDPIRRP